MIVNGFLTEIAILTVLVTFSTGDLSGCFVLDSDHFRHPPRAAFSVTNPLVMAITASLPIPAATHRSLVMLRSSRISASILSSSLCCRCRGCLSLRDVTLSPQCLLRFNNYIKITVIIIVFY
jgi:hypothetical protein